MKAIGLMLLAGFMWGSPTLAAEYQGQSLDHRQLPATVYSYATGATYEALVEFQGDRAHVEFPGGGQLTLQLRQSNITNLENIEGYGSVGKVFVGRGLFSFGLGYGRATDNLTPTQLNPLENFWRIRVNPAILAPAKVGSS